MLFINCVLLNWNKTIELQNLPVPLESRALAALVTIWPLCPGLKVFTEDSIKLSPSRYSRALQSGLTLTKHTYLRWKELFPGTQPSQTWRMWERTTCVFLPATNLGIVGCRQSGFLQLQVGDLCFAKHHDACICSGYSHAYTIHNRRNMMTASMKISSLKKV